MCVYLAVAVHPNEVCLGGQGDVQLRLVRPLPPVLRRHLQLQRVVISDVDLVGVTMETLPVYMMYKALTHACECWDEFTHIHPFRPLTSGQTASGQVYRCCPHHSPAGCEPGGHSHVNTHIQVSSRHTRTHTHTHMETHLLHKVGGGCLVQDGQ